jgi:hypothetical protein
VDSKVTAYERAGRCLVEVEVEVEMETEMERLVGIYVVVTPEKG